jgi:hypothetical protein
MGAVGGVTCLLIARALYPEKKTAGLTHINYFLLFAVIAAIMVAAVVVVMLTVPERKLDDDMQAWERAHPEENLAVDDGSGSQALPPRRSSAVSFFC